MQIGVDFELRAPHFAANAVLNMIESRSHELLLNLVLNLVERPLEYGTAVPDASGGRFPKTCRIT